MQETVDHTPRRQMSKATQVNLRPSLCKDHSTYRVPAGLWKRMYLEHGIVRRHWLECYVGMPCSGRGTAGLNDLTSQAATLLLLERADDTDLVAKFTPFLCQWVNV